MNLAPGDARALLTALWRSRRWWLPPLIAAALILAVAWLATPERPTSLFIYGR